MLSRAQTGVRRFFAAARLTLAVTTAFLCVLALPATVLAATVPAAGGGGGGEMTVVFVDVGQGSGAVIRSPDGTVHVFDAGPNGMGSAAMIPVINSLAPTAYGACFISHFHTDHHGGMDEVLNAFPFVDSYDRGDVARPTNQTTNTYLAAAGARRRTAILGQLIDLGGGVTARVLALNGTVLGQGSVSLSGTNQQENGRSIAIRVEYGDFSMWLGGDLTGGGSGTADVETPASIACGDLDVYVCNHHGSNTSTNQSFVTTTDPEVAIASAGLNNPFGHPTTNIVNRLNSATAARMMFSTTAGTGAIGIAAGGNITLTTDGTLYRVVTESAPGQGLDFFVDEVPTLDVNTVAGKLVLSEIQRNPTNVADENGEWFELVWTGEQPLPMKGTTIITDNGIFSMVTNMAAYPGRPVLLQRDGVRTRNASLPLGFVWPFNATFLGDTIGVLQVRYGTGLASIQDTISYDATFPGGAAVAAQRIDLAGLGIGSNFTAATTSYGIPTNLGTPGALNPADQTDLPATLVVETESAPGGGGELRFGAAALGSGGKPSIVALSLADAPGIPLFGAVIPLEFDILFDLSLSLPGAALLLPADGWREYCLPVPPGITGLPAFASHFIFDVASFTIPKTSPAVGFTFP